MPEKARVAVMLSGNGTTMSSLLFHSRLPGCPYEIVLVASNQPEARGLRIAEAEGIATFAHSHRGMDRETHEAIMDSALRAAEAEYIALAGYMRERYVHKERWIGALTRNGALASIAWATEDPIANLAMGRELHALLPAAPYRELDGVGHFVIFEDPDRVSEVVLTVRL